MKIAVICYHKNADKIYPKEWIDQYRESILRQSMINVFDIWEMNYGRKEYYIFNAPTENGAYWYPSIGDERNFIVALNQLLFHLFEHEKYDLVFNTNVDDLYHHQWIETIIMGRKYFLKGVGSHQSVQNYDLISCNFAIFEGDKITTEHQFHDLDIKTELNKNHNVICHPGVCYSKRFWQKNFRSGIGLYNPDEILHEDLQLWKRAITTGSTFHIVPETLVYHRLHNNSVTKSSNR